MTKNTLLATLLALLAACASVSEKDRELARVHKNLAQQSLSAGDPRAALAEIEKAVERDPENAEARNLHGLLLHLYFDRVDAAEEQYDRAIELKPDYSEAKVNLGALLTAQGRCAEAIRLLEEARRDLLYREPYLAENNLGWCRWKLGDADAALTHLHAAVAGNPKFCLGYRNLAEIHESRGEYQAALRYLDRYGKSCPEEADADFRRGVLLLKAGDDRGARTAFQSCRGKAKAESLAEECERQASLIPEG